MEYIRAFLVGGIICILVQILMDHTTLQPGRIMVLLVIAGVILGALGIYKRIEEFGGCGAFSERPYGRSFTRYGRPFAAA